MASYDNLMTMEPWAFRSAFGDSWYSDVFARETDALTKVLQKSLSTPVALPPQAAAEGFAAEMVFSVAVPETTPVQTPSASGPAGSGGSENETAGSKRRNVGPSGKITKRKSRAAKRATTTYITADAANFRQMVQQVTGVRFGGGAGKLPVPPILKPEPHRAVNQLPPHTAGCLPTLDTSAFLLDQKQHFGSSPASLIRPTTLTSPPPPPVADGGVTGFDFDAFSTFPTLESWN